MTEGALVTGAGKRIGRALALALGRQGYRVAVHYRSSSTEAEEVVAAIRDSGGTAEAVAADLSDSRQAETLIGQSIDAIGPLTCLINNASTFYYDGARDFKIEVWQRQMAVNLGAPAVLARDFANSLAEGQSGHVINLLDQIVAAPTPGHFSYTVSKTALATMTEMLAIALAPHVRVNAIAPGLTLPSGAQTETTFAEAHGQTLLERGTTLASIERALDYLNDAETVTGQILFVDGGERLLRRPPEDPSISPA